MLAFEDGFSNFMVFCVVPMLFVLASWTAWLESRAKQKAKEHREAHMKDCPVCRKFIAKTAESCPKCGHVF